MPSRLFAGIVAYDDAGDGAPPIRAVLCVLLNGVSVFILDAVRFAMCLPMADAVCVKAEAVAKGICRLAMSSM